MLLTWPIWNHFDKPRKIYNVDSEFFFYYYIAVFIYFFHAIQVRFDNVQCDAA